MVYGGVGSLRKATFNPQVAPRPRTAELPRCEVCGGGDSSNYSAWLGN